MYLHRFYQAFHKSPETAVPRNVDQPEQRWNRLGRQLDFKIEHLGIWASKHLGRMQVADTPRDPPGSR
jgi:hypothetical protein